MAESPGLAFNPLVIHGGIGLGKTHLLEGLAETIARRHPGMRVIHQTAEAFTNSFLEAMRAGTLNAFRSRYRSAELLILDDVHFLTSKRATQDEFQHTFDALVGSGAAVVLGLLGVDKAEIVENKQPGLGGEVAVEIERHLPLGLGTGA